jgi:hypothetical protein
MFDRRISELTVLTGAQAEGGDLLPIVDMLPTPITKRITRAEFFSSVPGLTLADGTAALPSLAFAGQTNTGLFRPAASILALSVNGTERARFTTAGVQVTGLISGTAVMQSANDTTAGRLPTLQLTPYAARAGFGGYWPDGTGRNIDTVPDGDVGLYGVGNPGTWPAGVSGFLWVETQKVYSGQAMVQTATRYTGTGTPLANVIIRWHRTRANDGTWGVWRPVYDSGSILGTVSQSGGVPTGAVMQAGANANGAFVRFADGHQICWQVFGTVACNTADGSLFRSAQQTWTFPAGFISASSYAAYAAPQSVDRWGSAIAANSSSANFYHRSAVSSATELSTRLTAIGRWF